MLKIISAVRPVLAALFVVILAACGGGDDETIPAGAQVCELKDYIPPSHGIQDPQNHIRSDGDGLGLTVTLVDGGARYALSNWQSFYAYVGTTSDRKPYGLVEGQLTVPVNKRTWLRYSNYLGSLNGRHVEGESSEMMVLGLDSSHAEDQVTPQEVQGIKLPSHGGAWPNDPHKMSAPRLTQLDQHLFRIQEGFYQTADWSRLSNATVEVEVLTDSETGSSSGYRHCEIRGLTGPVNTIAVVGGRPGEAYWMMTRTYAPLDGGIQAYSKLAYTRFQY